MSAQLIPSPPTCLITGKLIGHPDTCGDCDPCGAVHRLPECLRNITAEIVCWSNKYASAMGDIDGLSAAITAVEKERDELREALKPFAAADRALGSDPGPYRLQTFTGYREIERSHFRRARAALKKPEA